MANQVIITQNPNGTVEFKRVNNSLEILQAVLFGSCFQIDWNKAANDNIFEVFSGDNHFVLELREVDGPYTSQDLYGYLLSLTDCAGTGGGGGGDASAANQETTNEYLEKKNIGKILNLASDTGAVFAGFPLELLEPAFAITTIDGYDVFSGFSLSVADSKSLASILNSVQSLFVFSVIDATNLLISDGTKTVSGLIEIMIGTSNVGVGTLQYDTFANSADVTLSNLDVISEHTKAIESLNRSVLENIKLIPDLIKKNFLNLDAGGALPISNKTTLGNYVMDTNNISTQLNRKGTGNQNYLHGVSTMSVTSGQYAVCQSKQIHPYLAGKAQECEITCDRFQLENDVIKKVGLFTSDRVSPYNTNYDGFYFESNGVDGVYNLVVANGNIGTEIKIPNTSWDNQNISLFGNFNVFKIDFLYLGGTEVRFWIFNNGAFELLHTHKHANNYLGTIVKSPNLPVRWELRSTTGSGSMGQICATVTSGGSFNQVGRQVCPPITVNNINANNPGTTYLLKAIALSNITGLRKTILDFFISGLSATGDDIWIEVRINPTIATPALSFLDINDENGVATGLRYAEPHLGNPSTNSITGGTIIYGDFIGAVGRYMSTRVIDLIRKAGFDLDGVADIIALCATPLATGTNADLHGNLIAVLN